MPPRRPEPRSGQGFVGIGRSIRASARHGANECAARPVFCHVSEPRQLHLLRTDNDRARGSARLEAPEGFRYRAGLLESDEERELVDRIGRLPLTPFDFHGYVANRRVVSYGWRYSYDEGSLQPAEDMPSFLLPVRERAAAFGGIDPRKLVQALINEYRPGTSIGWHRDKPMFGDEIGRASCRERV